MKNFRQSFVSASLLAAGCAVAIACDSDDHPSNGNDAGTGGSTSTGGSSSGGSNSGGSGTGGRGGSSTGGKAGSGTGGVIILPDGGVRPRDGGRPDGATSDGGDAGAGAKLRLVHAAPGASAVDVYVVGQSKPIATNVTYGSATPYVTLDSGSYTFELRTAGSTASSTPIFTTPSIDVVGGSHYTAVAEGNVASTATADGFRVTAYAETFGPAVSGKARIRVVHANYDGPTVDLDVGNDDPATPEVKALERFGDSGAPGVEIDANTAVQVGVVVTGTTLTAFTTPKLDAGSDVFFVATGLASKLARDPLGLAVLAIFPDSSTVLVKQNPRLYVLHASTDAAAVDVFSGNAEVVDNADFGSLKLAQVPPGAVTLDLFAGAAGKTTRPVGAPLASLTTPVLDAGNNYLGVVAGTAKTQTPTIALKTIAEGFDLTKGSQALVRAVHGSVDTGKVDVGLVTTPGTLVTPPVFTGLSFGDASAPAGTSVAVGNATLGAAATGTTSTVAEFGVTTSAGERAFAVIGGSQAGGAHPLELFVIDTAGPFWSLTAVPKK